MRDKIREALKGLGNKGADRVKATLQRLDSMKNIVSGLGTEEDAALAARPSIDNRLSVEEIDTLYLTNDLARRIVEGLVDDSLRQGFEAVDAQTGVSVKEPLHLDIVTAVRHAAYSARLYGGGAVVMLFDSGNTQAALAETAGEPAALVAVDRYEATASRYTDDPVDPNFGKPELWRVSPNNASARPDLGAPEFHHSRVLSFTGAPLPSRLKTANDGWGDSVLQQSWTPLQNFTQAEAAIANIIQRFEVATYSIAGLADVLDDPEGASNLLRRMQLVQKTISMVRAVVIDRDAGEEYTRAFSSVNGLDTLWDRLAHSVAKSAKEPMTQLFGMSPSGLATDDQSGRANWRKVVSVFQDTSLEPQLRWYFQLLNGGKPVILRWNPLDEATAKEEAEIAKMRAETREIYVAMGSALPEEFRAGMQKEGVIEDAEDEVFVESLEEPEPPPLLPGAPLTEGGLPAPREPDDDDLPGFEDEEE